MTHIIKSTDLKVIVEKIERALDDKATITEHLNATYTEAKSRGYDVKILKQVIRLRRRNKEELEEEEELIDIYKKALGMT